MSEADFGQALDHLVPWTEFKLSTVLCQLRRLSHPGPASTPDTSWAFQTNGNDVPHAGDTTPAAYRLLRFPSP